MHQEISIEVNEETRVATVTLPQGDLWKVDLNPGETGEQFAERFGTLVRNAFGDRVKSLSITAG